LQWTSNTSSKGHKFKVKRAGPQGVGVVIRKIAPVDEDVAFANSGMGATNRHAVVQVPWVVPVLVPHRVSFSRSIAAVTAPGL
jgi:hypothetical protein